jgi:hypothetical protein
LILIINLLVAARRRDLNIPHRVSIAGVIERELSFKCSFSRASKKHESVDAWLVLCNTGSEHTALGCLLLCKLDPEVLTASLSLIPKPLNLSFDILVISNEGTKIRLNLEG